MRRRAKGEGDSVRMVLEGEAEGLRIRAIGQAKAQETIAKTLTPDYLRFKLYGQSELEVRSAARQTECSDLD